MGRRTGYARWTSTGSSTFFGAALDTPKYARMVGYDEIEKNEFNLNLPRYIDSQPPEDRQDIEGHLKGGIPERDVEALAAYWAVCPNLKTALFRRNRPGYLDLDLAVKPEAIRAAIHEHPEFRAFTEGLTAHFAAWARRDGAAESLEHRVSIPRR